MAQLISSVVSFFTYPTPSPSAFRIRHLSICEPAGWGCARGFLDPLVKARAFGMTHPKEGQNRFMQLALLSQVLAA